MVLFGVKHPVRRLIDGLLIILAISIISIVLSGGFRGELFGVEISATMPYGPVRFFLLLLLLRFLVSRGLQEAILLRLPTPAPRTISTHRDVEMTNTPLTEQAMYT